MPGDDRSTPREPTRVSNRVRLPSRVKSKRANMAAVPAEVRPTAAPPEFLTERAKYLAGQTTLTRADLATGRGLTYEWEFFVDQLFRNIAAGGGGGGGGGSQTYEFYQSSNAAVWTVNHGFGGYPNVLVIDVSGQELLAEVHYPDDQTVVIIHGQPYSGTAYLRI